MTVAIVTDSACDLSLDLASKLGIFVIPCYVHFGLEDFKDQIDLSTADFYHRLMNGGVFPKTSQPSPGDFVKLYRDIADKGVEGIVSIHVSSKISGTYNSAVRAKELCGVDCPIEIVDSCQASSGQGVVVVSTAKVLSKGGGMVEVVDAAKSAVKRAQFAALLDTLEYLEKGGRIGKVKALIGGILKFKPILKMLDGEAHPAGRARSVSQARRMLMEEVEASAPLEEAYVAYTTTPEEASEFAQSLNEFMLKGATPSVVQMGPTIGTHAGPGAIAVGLLQAKQ